VHVGGGDGAVLVVLDSGRLVGGEPLVGGDLLGRGRVVLVARANSRAASAPSARVRAVWVRWRPRARRRAGVVRPAVERGREGTGLCGLLPQPLLLCGFGGGAGFGVAQGGSPAPAIPCRRRPFPRCRRASPRPDHRRCRPRPAPPHGGGVRTGPGRPSAGAGSAGVRQPAALQLAAVGTGEDAEDLALVEPRRPGGPSSAANAADVGRGRGRRARPCPPPPRRNRTAARRPARRTRPGRRG
jgi:hypothetical protein